MVSSPTPVPRTIALKEITFKPNIIFKEVFTTKARYIDIWGGRARGGSHFATDYFLFLIMQPGYFRGCFLRAIAGDVRGSLWQDFKDRLNDLVEKGQVNERDFILKEDKMMAIYIPTGNSIISKGFKKSSSSSSAKLKSLAGITHVIIEECEEVDADDFTKLDDSLRTTKVENIQIIRLFNPPGKNHWLIKRYYNLEPAHTNAKIASRIDNRFKSDTSEPKRLEKYLEGWYYATPKDMPELLSIHSTYRDNITNVNESTKRNYRSYGEPDNPMYNPDFYFRDVLGLVSDGKKGRIFKKCLHMTLELFRSLPYPSFYGLDFGFSSDPAAVVELKYHNGKLFRHQLVYDKELTNDELIAKMRAVGVNPKQRMYADSAEPKSIREIQRAGFICIAAVKGPDSIDAGIKQLQSMEIYTTSVSKDLWEEAEEYSWELDSSKNPTDVPIDDFNHGWDASRYAVMSHIKKPGTVKTAKSGSSSPKAVDSWANW